MATTVVLRTQVLRSYKDILRAQRQLFKNGRTILTHTLTEQTGMLLFKLVKKPRSNTIPTGETNTCANSLCRSVADVEQIKNLIKFSEECKAVLEGGVVQGELVSDNTYRTFLDVHTLTLYRC